MQEEEHKSLVGAVAVHQVKCFGLIQLEFIEFIASCIIVHLL
jgi:hypothetical protein